MHLISLVGFEFRFGSCLILEDWYLVWHERHESLCVYSLSCVSWQPLNSITTGNSITWTWRRFFLCKVAILVLYYCFWIVHFLSVLLYLWVDFSLRFSCSTQPQSSPPVEQSSAVLQNYSSSLTGLPKSSGKTRCFFNNAVQYVLSLFPWPLCLYGISLREKITSI